MKKQHLFIFLGIALVFTVFFINFSSSELSYCCEKTTTSSSSGGAWCQNAPETDCRTDSGFKKAPTSCESTSYCKLGTCVDVNEGTCSENTPQVVCEEKEGVWYEESAANLGQCQLGCCAIGDQTAFVTQTRCKRLSSLYGLETNYRTDINSELECIITSQPDIEGACVFSREYERTCLRTTKAECQEFEASADKEDIEFYENKLCSDQNLGTNCGPSKKTTCVEGEDRIYFLDTCGNLANIYDSSKYDSVNDEWDLEYWSTIANEEDICGYDSSNGNANSKSCGNCDYYFGSTCKDYSILDDSEQPDIGDNICADLGCEYNDEPYLHGETWCGYNVKLQENDLRGKSRRDIEKDEQLKQSPGSSSYRYLCYNGEVTVEPCADYRQEICTSGLISNQGGTYRVAACTVNRWQDCFNQQDNESCSNYDERDCTWVEGRRFDGEIRKEAEEQGYCVPSISPGYDFWKEDTSAKDTCDIASIICTVTYEEGLFGGGGFLGFGSKEKGLNDVENCVDSNGKDIDPAWLDEQREMCLSMGDCGIEENYLGQMGYEYDDNDWTKNLEETE